MRKRASAISAGFLPIMMEYFTASGEFPPLESCLNRVSEANVAIAIVAHRHGWEPSLRPPEKHKSVTWLECERAVTEGKEILAFAVDDKFHWPASSRQQHRLTSAVREGRGTVLESRRSQIRRGQRSARLAQSTSTRSFREVDCGSRTRRLGIVTRLKNSLRRFTRSHFDSVLEPLPSTT